MSEDKSPLEIAIEQALDAFVYAPIGLFFDGPELFPKLAERGRNQVQVARMMGEMAVKMGQTEAGKRLSRTEGPVRDALSAVGLVPPADRAAAPDVATATGATAAPPVPTAEEAPAPSPAAARATAKKAAKKAAKAAKPSGKAAGKGATAPASAASLPITDYDSLSASQVVNRLQGLAVADLAAVRAYEAATRSRKTILNRITQLQKG